MLQTKLSLGLVVQLFSFTDDFKHYIFCGRMNLEIPVFDMFQVEQLIQWLMGIPIGLKLNSPLNQFLGKFFLHHVQLWLEYVELTLSSLQSTYSQSIFLQWTLSLSCFGLSLFFGFLSDVVSLLSFHIYCFYVYAARLYRLQVMLSFLISLHDFM